MTDLSPAAQAVYNAVLEICPAPADEIAAAALRSLASTWETEISSQPRTKFIGGIRNCITSLREIAEDLEGQS